MDGSLTIRTEVRSALPYADTRNVWVCLRYQPNNGTPAFNYHTPIALDIYQSNDGFDTLKMVINEQLDELATQHPTPTPTTP